jgi:predicted MPP superfamily phosphohydrolase
MFGTILISVCTFMHVYVFWRTASVPFVNRYVSRKMLILAGITMWAIFFFGRVFGHGGTGTFAETLEFLGMNWMAVLFLTFIPLLTIDLTTLFGLLMPRLSPSLRGWALLVGLVLSVIAFIQGMRPPVVEKYEVSISGLPDAMDGMVLVALSDMHLGSQLGEKWLAARVAQVNAQRPDLVVLLGDIFEGHGPPEGQMIAAIKQLSAPMGIWAVPGNHEFHRGGDMSLFEDLNFKLLRNSWTEVKPSLVLAGVDDFTARRRSGLSIDTIAQTLVESPAGAIILLSHTPWEADKAAKAGVDLMLSGHTHGGQIWPFDYLVRSRYPLLEGRYEIDDMTIIVCRGTGTWGPRMRLWRPSEILHVTIRGAKKKNLSVGPSKTTD